MHIRIGTRRSDLARIQAKLVGETLVSLGPHISVEYIFKNSEGDLDTSTPLWQLPDKGVFTRDLTDLIISGEIDIAVHSWKDLPLLDGLPTSVRATLPRADMRDVLLIRKDYWPRVVSSSCLNILSSSPRRAYNLQGFLSWALPTNVREINFISVRGNVQTRIKKLLESDHDGLVVAKAALDRLLERNEADYQAARSMVQGALDKCYWMITPLSANPCAAGQGALAVEALKTRIDLDEIFSRINCIDTFNAVNYEREVLQQFGGGCHQKIGMAVLNRAYGRISFLRGQTDAGEVLRRSSLDRSGKNPPYTNPPCTTSDFIWPLESSDAAFFESRLIIAKPLPGDGTALWVAKAMALPVQWKISFDTVCWAAGLDTWRKLAQRGVWVHGSSESLGESEARLLENFIPHNIRWVKLSHKDAPDSEDLPLYPTYELIPTGNLPNLKGKTHFYWRSASSFREALRQFPDIALCWHSSGPGNTFNGIKQVLGDSAKLSVYLNHEQWLNDVLE